MGSISCRFSCSATVLLSSVEVNFKSSVNIVYIFLSKNPHKNCAWKAIQMRLKKSLNLASNIKETLTV